VNGFENITENAMNEPVVRKETHALAMSEQELMNVLRNSLYPGAQDESIKMVIGYCKASGLDPMQKPVHIVPMWDSKARTMRDVIMPGIGSYRTQAARSGEYAGISEPEFGPDVTEEFGNITITYPSWCRVVVKRLLANGLIAEFAATERWKENYATAGKDSQAPNAMWKKRPYAQLAKCAEAQALRKAFPEIGAQPTADEMEGKIIDDGAAVFDGGVNPNNKEYQKELPVYTDAQLAKNLPAWQEAINSDRTTADKIIAKVSSGYRLTQEITDRIRSLEKQQEVDPFVADMESSEQFEQEYSK
jgi:phage recombination protein Bet